MDWTLFAPAELPLHIAWLLLGCSLLTSLITASFGAGGGVLLLIVLSLWLPPVAIIPVHGMIQLGSNAGRASMAWRHIDWRFIAWFLPGAMAGAAIGSLLLIQLPAPVLQISIAAFVLYLCWGPKLPGAALSSAGILMMSALTSFLSLFVGATGPLVVAYIRQMHSERFRTVATFAASMTLQHIPKAIVFGAAGFLFADWLLFIVAMIACGAVGTWLGLKVLGNISDQRFVRIFNVVLSLLALRLLWQAVVGLGIFYDTSIH